MIILITKIIMIIIIINIITLSRKYGVAKSLTGKQFTQFYCIFNMLATPRKFHVETNGDVVCKANNTFLTNI
jgi:hypothetical protein